MGVFFSLLLEEDFFINNEELNAFLKESLQTDSFTNKFIQKTLQNEAKKQEVENKGVKRGKEKSGGLIKRIELERKDVGIRKDKEGRKEEEGLGERRVEEEGKGKVGGGGKGRGKGGGKGVGGRDGVPTLHRAVDRLDVKMVEKFLEKGKGEEPDEDGNTPLHLIMGNWGERENGRKIAEMLVTITKNFNNLNKMACTPIHMAVKNSQIFALEWALDWNFKRREEKRSQMKENKVKSYKEEEVKKEDNDSRKEDKEKMKDLRGGKASEGKREGPEVRKEENWRKQGGEKDEMCMREEFGGGREEERRRREKGGEGEEEDEEGGGRCMEDEEKLFDFDKRTGPFLYSPLHLASYIGNSGITELFSRYPREVDFFQKNKSGKTARKVASKSLLQLKLLLKEEKV